MFASRRSSTYLRHIHRYKAVDTTSLSVWERVFCCWAHTHRCWLRLAGSGLRVTSLTGAEGCGDCSPLFVYVSLFLFLLLITVWWREATDLNMISEKNICSPYFLNGVCFLSFIVVCFFKLIVVLLLLKWIIFSLSFWLKRILWLKHHIVKKICSPYCLNVVFFLYFRVVYLKMYICFTFKMNHCHCIKLIDVPWIWVMSLTQRIVEVFVLFFVMFMLFVFSCLSL